MEINGIFSLETGRHVDRVVRWYFGCSKICRSGLMGCHPFMNQQLVPRLPKQLSLFCVPSSFTLCNNKIKIIHIWMFPKRDNPQIIHFNRVFHYKPYILGYPYFWKHPHIYRLFPEMVVLWYPPKIIYCIRFPSTKRKHSGSLTKPAEKSTRDSGWKFRTPKVG